MVGSVAGALGFEEMWKDQLLKFVAAKVRTLQLVVA